MSELTKPRCLNNKTFACRVYMEVVEDIVDERVCDHLYMSYIDCGHDRMAQQLASNAYDRISEELLIRGGGVLMDVENFAVYALDYREFICP